MRDIVVTLMVLIGCIYTIKRPYVGVLLWSWLSYMNPHRLCYGFAYGMPFAYITAVFLLISFFFTKDKNRFPVNPLTVTWVLFILFMGLTTIFAYFPDQASNDFIRTIKIQFISILTVILINDKDKLKQLIWVIVVSLGFFSIKGGLFTILTGGSHRVWGPEGSFIEENNSLAVAILMVIPLMIFLSQISRYHLIKKGLLLGGLLSLFTVLGSQSRGALIAISVVGFFYWLKSNRKIISGAVIVVMATILLNFMPDSWYRRMNTIETYEEDGSAMGRINAWEYAFNAANHNLLGMGFNSWSYETFAQYAPNPSDVHAAHSIYFGVMADHGWIGLLLFLGIFILSWRKLSNLVKKTRNDNEHQDLHILGKMMQVSFLAYLSGGAFLSLSYFDLPWHLVSITLIVERIIDFDKIKLQSAMV